MATRTAPEEDEEEEEEDSGSARSEGEQIEESDDDEDYNDCDSSDDDDYNDCTQQSDHERKSQNVAHLLRGDLLVKRQPLIPRLLSVSEAAAIARKPFKPPCGEGYSDDHNQELARRLSARKRFVPWGSGQPLMPISNLIPPPLPAASAQEDALEKKEELELPPGVEPLILWHSDQTDKENNNENSSVIEVDPLLVRYLRPHQREGVQFMFDCVSGLSSAEGISGCILADDMGLGKTLQSITLLYTLLRQGFDGKKPIVKRALIVTPTSLVSNWESEINKWLGGRVLLLSLCESTRADVLSGIDCFLKPCSHLQVLIISYETFRMHSAKFERPDSCDLLICDEAHRLKNDQTLTNKALAALPCKRRILLSGTPMQNDLEEFFSMVNFTNPGILGDVSYFRRYYEAPIITGREPIATSEEKKLGAERSLELSSKVNQFILRRTNTLLSNHLPPKIIEVVCCKLTPLQITLYKHFIQSKNVRRLMTEDAKQSTILACITNLKKLCNHPKLIYDAMKSSNSGTTAGFDNCLQFFPPELFAGRSGAWNGGGGIWVELSGKMHVLARLLSHLRQRTNDRIVLVSNYTQTLDLFAQLCRERRYPFVRLDGTTSISKRQKLVNRFNDPSKDEFAFLLSSKAGGCGLNLIGGNRLVLFDPDWNPANDKQAAARVWRDGQKKRVYIYRFLSTGTIEEKVYQRQMSKEGLQKVIQQGTVDTEEKGNSLSREDLRDLFTFRDDVRSEIHENMKCTRCGDDNNTAELSGDGDIGGFAELSGCLHQLKRHEKQIGSPPEEDLVRWGHHSDPSTVPDNILQSSAGNEISFVFTNQVDGKLVPVDSVPKHTAEYAPGQLKQQKCSLESSNNSPILQRSSIKFHSKSSLRAPPQSRSPFLNKPIACCDNRAVPKQKILSCDASDDDFV